MTYAAEVLADAPAAYYRMQESSGLPQDSSGNGRHMTASSGTAVYQQPGPIASDPSDFAIEFSASQWFSSPDGAWFDFGDTFSLEFWFKRAGDTGTTETVLAKGTGAPQIQIDPTDVLILNVRGSGTVCTNTDGGIPNPSPWRHVVMTKSGAAAKIWIDTVDRTGAITNHTATNTATALFMGARDDGNFLLDAVLDEVAIYTTVLSSARVLAHFQAAQHYLLRPLAVG